MAIGTTAAILGAAALGTAGSLASGAMGANAAGKAAQSQADSANASLALQERMYQQGRTDSLPWMNAGRAALSQYMGELGIPMPANDAAAPTASATPSQPTSFGGVSMNPSRNQATLQRGATAAPTAATPQASRPQKAAPFKSAFRATPGYQFQVEQGERGVVNNMAALGMKNSGAALKALTRFRTGLADQTYNTYLDRLAGMAGAGASTAANQGQLGAASAVNQGQTLTDAGAARASGYVGSANAWSNALGNVSNNAGWALGMSSNNFGQGA